MATPCESVTLLCTGNAFVIWVICGRALIKVLDALASPLSLSLSLSLSMAAKSSNIIRSAAFTTWWAGDTEVEPDMAGVKVMGDGDGKPGRGSDGFPTAARTTCAW
eukprot:CAMPEP_0168215188 /NCGR_PEP_ID=MMETSP0140_2-20121125/5785_1 /TAXON_ID=44445 /ORGANISM="Pseudo-nitzschia australis, Strain 10249 10 AB" /LENGTH=105 /DNA_ID=CAMNT_0008142269 /DNA_START=329 /DNA_END=643 /DNA_ORIENTATION=+